MKFNQLSPNDQSIVMVAGVVVFVAACAVTGIAMSSRLSSSSRPLTTDDIELVELVRQTYTLDRQGEPVPRRDLVGYMGDGELSATEQRLLQVEIKQVEWRLRGKQAKEIVGKLYKQLEDADPGYVPPIKLNQRPIITPQLVDPPSVRLAKTRHQLQLERWKAERNRLLNTHGVRAVVPDHTGPYHHFQGDPQSWQLSLSDFVSTSNTTTP